VCNGIVRPYLTDRLWSIYSRISRSLSHVTHWVNSSGQQSEPDRQIIIFKLLAAQIPDAELQVIFSASEYPIGRPTMPRKPPIFWCIWFRMTERHLPMPSTVEFPLSDDEALPTIPITLSHAGLSVSANALLDNGSTVNLYLTTSGRNGCNLGGTNCPLAIGRKSCKGWSRGLFVYVQIGNLEPVRLAFAWAKTSQIPLILGQTNFFREFDVCFQRSRCTIEIIRF